MTKLSSLSALSAVVFASLSLSLAGCAEETPAPATEVAETDESETVVSAEEELKGAISFTTLSAKKPNAPEGLTVIESKSEYVAFFGTKPPASVDFNKHWVLHESSGVKSTGGYATSVKSVKRVGKGEKASIVVETKDVAPGPMCMVTMALTNPQATVRINKQPGVKLSELVRKTTLTDCSEPNFCAAALCAVGTLCDESTDSCLPDPNAFCPRVRCASGFVCSEELRQCVDNDGDPCNPNPCGAEQTCLAQYPKCPALPDGSVNPDCHPTAVCTDPAPPENECTTDADCAKGLLCQPAFVCIKAPCNSPMICR